MTIPHSIALSNAGIRMLTDAPLMVISTHRRRPSVPCGSLLPRPKHCAFDISLSSLATNRDEGKYLVLQLESRTVPYRDFSYLG